MYVQKDFSSVFFFSSSWKVVIILIKSAIRMCTKQSSANKCRKQISERRRMIPFNSSNRFFFAAGRKRIQGYNQGISQLSKNNISFNSSKHSHEYLSILFLSVIIQLLISPAQKKVLISPLFPYVKFETNSSRKIHSSYLFFPKHRQKRVSLYAKNNSHDNSRFVM